jgi:MerR family transcriptional regulator, light-induced transcriptional regulator
MADDGDALLTLQEAADRLKVHYMTAYRWVRRGDLAAFKAGGRLRVRTSDVDTFVSQRRVDVAMPQAGRTQWPTHMERFYDLVVDGRGVDAASLVRKVVADGAPAGQVYLELITPTLHRLGDAWLAGDISVAQEHRASEICTAVMARLSDAFRRRGPVRGTAVTLTPPGELHGIAAAMVADFLRGGGYDVHHLGVNVPLEDLKVFLEIVPCDLLCVSVTTTTHGLTTYSGLVDAAGTDGTMVIVGGRGADPDAASQTGAHHVPELASLLPWLETAKVAAATRS